MAFTGLDDFVRIHFPIERVEHTPDGIVVYGKCTDGTLDADQQIVDTDWSGQALEEWLKTGGNVRVQHSPFLYPAGKGLALDIDKDGDGAHWLKALVVEDTAMKLVDKGVLRDFSIGILDPRLVSDYRAPQGRISGGRIGEVSLVDRGSNKHSSFTIAKAAKDGPARLVCKMTGATPLAMGNGVPSPATLKAKKPKIKDSSGKDRSDVPEGDFAGPHHSFPVEDRADVPDAASLAHHAADPAGVRDNIKDIANRKWPDMDLPPSLQDDKDTANKAEGTKTCMACHAKNPADAKRCEKCNKKLGMALKADAAQDYPGDKGSEDSETTEDYAAGGDDDGDGDEPDEDDKPDKASKADGPTNMADYTRQVRKAAKAKRGKKGRDPASAGRAKGKDSVPAPTPPIGSNEGGPVGSVLKSDGPSFTIQRLHHAVCPAVKAGQFRRTYAIKSVGDAIPLRELQTLAMEAIGDGDTFRAGHLLDAVSMAQTIQHIGPDVLMEARKAFPELFPTAHPTQQQNLHPGQFSRGYIGSGHPPLSAQAAGNGLPDAIVHHVSAQDFRRGHLADGRAAVSPDEGRQATFDSAPMGQAANAMARLHQSIQMTWPELCGINVTQWDNTQGDGGTGLNASSLPQNRPTAPGEAGSTPGNFARKNDETGLRKKLAKAQRKLADQADEIRRLGAMPDPERAAFRGIPVLDGPVDRESFIDKAASTGSEGPDPEYVEFVNKFAGGGNPAMRANARKVLETLVTS